MDVSRGNPIPHTLKGEALVRARLTEDTWRLEITADTGSKLERPLTLPAGTALTLETLHRLGAERRVRFLKAMQCNNIPLPLGQGIWEGVPLREVLSLAGTMENVRRIYFWGYHNNDPAQVFQSSLSLNQVLDSAPGELPALVAYRLNGAPIPLVRGGPVRMIVPWAHGFKSIKWLQRIVLTNDYRANDTYAEANNDPESYLKTAAYFLNPSAESFRRTQALLIRGWAMVGLPGLRRVECWLRPEAGTHGALADEDPAWAAAHWTPCSVEPPPENWRMEVGHDPRTIWGFDAMTGKPRQWPMRYSVARWAVTFKGLRPGGYELRVRSVDENGFAQPKPRRNQQSGLNGVQCKQFVITA